MVFHSVLLTLILSITYAAVQESGIERRPVLMRCVDPDCSVPISVGKTMVNYPRRGSDFLSFKPDSHVVILGKPADSVSPLAYAEIENKKGLVPLNLIREEKVVGKLGLTVPWPLVVKNAPVADSVPATDPISEPNIAHPDPQTTQSEVAANHSENTEGVDESSETENVTNNVSQVDQIPPVRQSPAPRQDLPPATPPEQNENNAQNNEPLTESPEINTVPAHEPVNISDFQSTDNLSLPAVVSNLSTDSSTSDSLSEQPVQLPPNASELNLPSVSHDGSSVDAVQNVTEQQSENRTESTPTYDQSEETRQDVSAANNFSNVEAAEQIELPVIQNPSPYFDTAASSFSTPVIDAVAEHVTEQPVTTKDANESSVHDDFIPAPPHIENVTPVVNPPEEPVLVADESPAVLVKVSLDPPVIIQPISPAYDAPLPFTDFDTSNEVTTLSPLTESVTSSTSDLYADTTQTVPSNLTDGALSAGEVFGDSVLPEASDSLKAFESAVPDAYLDTMRLYLSCLDILPSPLHDFMDRNNVTPHGVILTLIVGFLWILMMVAQMVISRNSRHTELEGVIERNAAIISRLRTETSVMQQNYASENEKLSRLEGSLKDWNEKLVNAEDACRTAEDKNRTLVSQLKELEEKLEKQQQVNQCLQQEQERLVKESQDWKSQATRSAADVTSLQQSCQQKEAELESLTQENDSHARSEKDLIARQESLQQQILQLQNDMERLRASSMEQDVRIDELSNENDLLKAQVQEKDNLNNALKEMLEELDAAKSRQAADETDWGDDEFESKIDLLEVAHVRADQKALLKQKNDLEQSLSEVRREKDALSKEISDQQEFVRSSARQVEEAVAAKNEAEKRLQVLEKYFNSREVELQRELGALQVRRQQKEEDASSLEKRLQDLEGEKDSYQSQLESMRRELSESERSFKSQLANMEKRAHENWVAARNAEREASDLRRDAVFLRQQLTMMAGSGNSQQSDNRSDSSVNGTMIDFSSMPLPPPPPPPMPPMAMSQHPVMHHEFLYQNHGYAPIAEQLDSSGSRPESVIRDTASVPIDCDGPAAAGGGSSASSLYEYPFIPPPPPPPSGAFPDPFLMSSMFPHSGYPPDASAAWDKQAPTQPHSGSGAHHHYHPQQQPHQPPPSHSSGPPV